MCSEMCWVLWRNRTERAAVPGWDTGEDKGVTALQTHLEAHLAVVECRGLSGPSTVGGLKGFVNF